MDQKTRLNVIQHNISYLIAILFISLFFAVIIHVLTPNRSDTSPLVTTFYAFAIITTLNVIDGIIRIAILKKRFSCSTTDAYLAIYYYQIASFKKFKDMSPEDFYMALNKKRLQ